MGRSRPGRHVVVVCLLVLVATLGAAPVHAVEEATDAGEGTSEGGEGAEASTGSTDAAPALDLTVRPVAGDGGDDGDLRLDDETGLPTLVFSPARPTVQTAVVEVTVRNPGPGVLDDVAVSGARVGDLDLGTTTLAPGAAVTVRATVTVTAADAHRGLAGLVVLDLTATARADGAPVTAEASTEIQVVAVLGAVMARAALALVAETSDLVVLDGQDTLVWTADQAAADEPRAVHLRVSLDNTGSAAVLDLTSEIDLLGTTTAVAVPTVMMAGEVVQVDVVHQVRPSSLTQDAAVAAAGMDVLAALAVAGVDEATGQPVALADTVTLRAVVEAPAPAPVAVLPAAGLGTRGDVLTIALLSVGLGLSLLTAAPRRRATARRV